ncbi:MAG: peptide chain release factor 2 [Coriobacteriales bacterium]|jgi:peptide chain release factor 2|nr:peptide chain release factor 2 [Coriobacteriales bacterium]
MIEDLSARINEQRQRLDEAAKFLHIEDKRSELGKLEETFTEPDFWNDQQRASSLSKEAAGLRSDVGSYDAARELLGDLDVGNELALAEDDEDLYAEAAANLADLGSRIDQLELSSWFTGQFDSGDAIVNINPGQGGLEAQDWTDMLYRMYLRYVQRKGWKVEELDAPSAEVIGIDHATFIVSGHNAYGMLSAEIGVHRLVRISPTDVKQRRQTTFAGVEVLPVLPEDIEVEIKDGDLRIDVFRSSGPGGQSVNTTDSAVRITHLPTNTVVTCQNEKSQIQNKESAMKILKSRLYELEQAKREAELESLRGPKVEAAWGNQIRNYVLYPYQQVKDTRTGIETGDVDSVLKEGDLDQFIIAFLKQKAMLAKA